MLAEELDRMNGTLNADMKVFIAKTSQRLGALEDQDPEKFPGLRDMAAALRDTLIRWRRGYRNTFKAGYPDEAAKALIDSGARLHAALRDLDKAVRRASPTRLGELLGEVKGTIVGVSGDIATGLQAVGKAAIAAGEQSLVLVKYLPWLALAVGAAYVVGPPLLKAFMGGGAREARA